MTTEALKKENIRLTATLADTEAEKNRLNGLVAEKYTEVKKWNDMYNQLYKEKMVAPENATSVEIQRATTVLAAAEAEKNRLAGIIAEKNTEVKRWYDMYTKLYEEKMVTPETSAAEEMQRRTAVLADAEAEKNRLAGVIAQKDMEVKRWYGMYTKLYEEKTVTPESLTASEMQRLTAALADTEAEKSRLAGLIAEKDVEIKRWYALYNKLYEKKVG